MPSKAGLTLAEKQNKVLAYLHQTRTCHTLKELEKAIPPIASVHSATVKDFIKELTDENKVKVEKIGSGNWYWCWAGEEARNLRDIRGRLEAEKSKVEAVNSDLRQRVDMLTKEHSATQKDEAHQTLLQQSDRLEAEVKALTMEKDEWENSSAGTTEGMLAEATRLRRETAESTDNIYILEAHLLRLAGGDRGAVDAVRRECYGGLYVEDEELGEIEGL